MISAHANRLTGSYTLWKLQGEVATGNSAAATLPITHTTQTGSAPADEACTMDSYLDSDLREPTRKWNTIPPECILGTYAGTLEACILCKVSWRPIHKK